MDTTPRVTFFHALQSRSAGTRALLEELGADYELQLLDLKAGEQRRPQYLAINPMGKVPAIHHAGALVTEQPAVFIYLADLYPAAKLAPPLGDPLRGPYLRWLVFYGSCFEPAMVDKSMQRAPAPPSTCGYGDYDTMLQTLVDQLEQGPYLLGDSFSAADVLWGTALNWTTLFKLVPELPVIRAYIDRVLARPAMQRAAVKDAELLAARAG
ncbi:glutathione S-transferase family protein [Rhodanobacter denitrificans]|uniref:glutathione S-transferase family protein n=1 Tax=Rhodanobacter denitrificans TaxID=666685 RepID=UPI000260E60D|nr:glutathione S-transferase family protein [Rhodanobacter denitrificans]EIM03154.1 glutathione S-transferase [Rhodanobacter denitrificans]UJM90353.1 glutathione S-transferase family protein [Rhodanobacter denitrificans]